MFGLITLGALLLPLAIILQPTLATDAATDAASLYTTTGTTTPKDNNENCTCYVVPSGKDSVTPQYFQYYRYYDFRNLQAFDQSPPQINNTQVAGDLPTWQPRIFDSDAWNADWAVQNWSKPATSDFPIPMNNSYANVYIGAENNTSFLTLRTHRQNDYQTSGEIENQQRNLMHVSMRMYARVKGAKGAVAGFFTFHDDNNESDIEVLTRDNTDQIHYTNQPSVDKKGNEIQQASKNPTGLPTWDEWRLHRIDWLPGTSYWYIDGKQVAANSYSVPRKQSYLVLNMWSDGGEWSGNMTVGDSAQFQIQWIDMAFNTSGNSQGDGKRGNKRDIGLPPLEQEELSVPVSLEKRKASHGCVSVCKIDQVAKQGTPEVASYTPSAASGLSASPAGLLLVGVLSIFMAL